MSVLLQVSDPHFGTERAPVVEALVALAQRERPALVVLSGDITQRARPAQFRAARAFADRLGAPLLAIPGNHDLPLFDLLTRLLRPYARYRAAFGDELEPVFASDAWLVVGVNTTRPARHENGEVDDAQVARVAARLAAAAPGQLRVVVVHQPAAVARAEDEHDRLIGHAAALAHWSAAGADIVMGGHIHLPYVLPVEGVPRPLWVVQAGTAVSERVREGVPNSVNLLRWDGRGAQIEQWDCPAGGPAFTCQAVTTISPARSNDGR
ncbi:metallophosphoesterase family protein [Rhizobacter fulvus]